MRILVAPLSVALILAAGCDRSSGERAVGLPPGPLPPDSVVVETPNSDRTWAGLLPCRDCQGIETRLVLRSAAGRRDYLMTETYLGGTGRNSFNSAGTWVEISSPGAGEPATLVILDPDQAGQRFALQPDGALELLDGEGKPSSQGVANRLQRL